MREEGREHIRLFETRVPWWCKAKDPIVAEAYTADAIA